MIRTLSDDELRTKTEHLPAPLQHLIRSGRTTYRARDGVAYRAATVDRADDSFLRGDCGGVQLVTRTTGDEERSSATTAEEPEEEREHVNPLQAAHRRLGASDPGRTDNPLVNKMSAGFVAIHMARELQAESAERDRQRDAEERRQHTDSPLDDMLDDAVNPLRAAHRRLGVSR